VAMRAVVAAVVLAFAHSVHASRAARQLRSEVRAKRTRAPAAGGLTLATSGLSDELRRVYSAVAPVSGACADEPALRRSLRQAYEPRLQPVARTPTSAKLEKLLEHAKQSAECGRCGNSGIVACPACSGQGALGGHDNMLPSQIIGSKWTRISFCDDGGVGSKVLVTVLKLGFKERRVYAQVAAVSSKGAGDGTTAWVPLAEMRDRARWRAGWLSVAEIEQPAGQKACPAGCVDGRSVCKSCNGRGSALAYRQP